MGCRNRKSCVCLAIPMVRNEILDSVYWYYADGELKGWYVRFDATTGYVNGWSTFSPKPFQIDYERRGEGPATR